MEVGRDLAEVRRLTVLGMVKGLILFLAKNLGIFDGLYDGLSQTRAVTGFGGLSLFDEGNCEDVA